MTHPHAVRAGREQARRAGPGRRAVQPARLQHRVARGRPDRAPEISRMTIVVVVDDLPLEQVTKQLNKLVNVIKIVELDPAQSVQRELLLVKVRADAAVRSAVLETAQPVPGQDRRRRAPESVTIEATGTADKLSRAAPGARAVRDQGDGAVRHGRGRPRAALDHRHRAARARPLRPDLHPTQRSTRPPGLRRRAVHAVTRPHRHGRGSARRLHPTVQRGHQCQPGCSTTTTPTCR